MGALRRGESRSRGVSFWTVLITGAALLATGAGAWLFSAFRLTAVTPPPDSWVNRKAFDLSVAYEGRPGSTELLVDGRPVPLVDSPARRTLDARVTDLSNGKHSIDLVVHRRLGFGAVRRAWSVNVDTVAPRITLKTPAAGAMVREAHATLSGKTKPGIRVKVTVTPTPVKGDGRTELKSGAKGEFSVDLPLAEDKNHIRIDAVDLAGNHAVTARDILCDLHPPDIGAMKPASGTVVRDSPDVTLQIPVTKEKGSTLERATLTVGNRPPETLEVGPRGGELTFKALDLPEGTAEITLEVQDKAGWIARKTFKFLVDTTETFGRRPMTRGAIGKDVRGLQQRLVKWGDLAEEDVSGTYDGKTEQAVESFQSKHKIDSDGIAGMKTIAALSPSIFVDLANFTLTLYDGGEKVRSYGIAHGTPEYPTPPGSFRITYLEKNPTWFPPQDSLWAREAKVTPPGPGNPLGTRWIGLDSAAVGIHGTPAAWTIGSRASHGCIRMRIPDVEDLFERLNPGCEVTISWGPPARPKKVGTSRGERAAIRVPR